MKVPGRVTFEGLRHLFKKPATTTYPAVPAVVHEDYRGQIVFDANKCIGCLACMRDCPSRAIEIGRVGEKKEKRFDCTFYLDRCIYCAQCVDSCIRSKAQALTRTNRIELAQLTRDALKVYYPAKAPAPASASDEGEAKASVQEVTP